MPTPSILHKALHSSSYLDSNSDTRSMSNETTGAGDGAAQQQQQAAAAAAGAQQVAAAGIGSGGKLGYNNNQYVAGAHASVLSAEIQLGHIDDPISSSNKPAPQQQLDNKSETSDIHDGPATAALGGGPAGAETTETKSMSSIKSGGSNADARYIILLLFYSLRSFSFISASSSDIIRYINSALVFTFSLPFGPVCVCL